MISLTSILFVDVPILQGVSDKDVEEWSESRLQISAEKERMLTCLTSLLFFQKNLPLSLPS